MRTTIAKYVIKYRCFKNVLFKKLSNFASNCIIYIYIYFSINRYWYRCNNYSRVGQSSRMKNRSNYTERKKKKRTLEDCSETFTPDRPPFLRSVFSITVEGRKESTVFCVAFAFTPRWRHDGDKKTEDLSLQLCKNRCSAFTSPISRDTNGTQIERGCKVNSKRMSERANCIEYISSNMWNKEAGARFCLSFKSTILRYIFRYEK